MAETAKIVPNNFEAEQAVLCCIMIDSENAQQIVSAVDESCFYTTAHRTIYNAIVELNKTFAPLDYVAVCNKLTKEGTIDKVGGIVYVSDLTNLLPTSANWKYYVDIIKHDALMRSLIAMSNKIAERCYTDTTSADALAFAQSELLKIYNEEGNKSLVHIDSGFDKVLDRFNDMLAGKPIKGCQSGFPNLDRVIGCYQPGQVIVLAARPGCGKTSFAMNIVANIALKHKEKVIAVFNLEMGMIELAQRFMLSVAEVPYASIAEKKSTSCVNALWNVKKELADSNIFIDESTETSADAIFAKLKELKLRKGRLDFVIIDYLQLMQHVENKGDSYQNAVAKTSRALKIMAKQLEVPIMVLSQTSRGLERREDKTPMMSDLRDSGAIEQDADQIYFLVKDDKQEEEEFEKIELHIVKNRSGEAGRKLTFKWQGNIVKFTPLTDGYTAAPKNNTAHNGDSADNDEEIPDVVITDNGGAVVVGLDDEFDTLPIDIPAVFKDVSQEE